MLRRQDFVSVLHLRFRCFPLTHPLQSATSPQGSRGSTGPRWPGPSPWLHTCDPGAAAVSLVSYWCLLHSQPAGRSKRDVCHSVTCRYDFWGNVRWYDKRQRKENSWHDYQNHYKTFNITSSVSISTVHCKHCHWVNVSMPTQEATMGDRLNTLFQRISMLTWGYNGERGKHYDLDIVSMLTC